MITDSQVHIWEVDRPDRPWPEVRNTPQLPNGYAAEAMVAEMDAAGVDRAVIVPPTWIGENNSTALEAVAAYPERFAIMGRFNPTRPDAQAALDGWKAQPGMLGIRMTFRVPPHDRWLDDNTLDGFWPACEKLGIPLMMLMPGILPKLEPIAAKHPGLSLIIDHMACEIGATVPKAFEQIDTLLTLAKYPNVYVKTSSAPCFSNDPYPFADVYGYLKSIIQTYGAQRCLWGADLTRLTSTYPECLRHFSEGLDFLSASDKEWILGKAAAGVLNWPEA